MTEPTAENQGSAATMAKVELERKLDAVGWGLFFVWIGIALLANLGWGVGLLGVGAITLGEQAARRYSGVRLDEFWIVVGLLFLAGGVWELSEIQISMVPFLLIVAGVAVLVSAFRQRRK